MTSIPHVADAMRTVLEAVARTVARTSGAIKRERAMDGAQLVQTLVFGWLANPDATMHHLVAMAKTLGVTISPSGLSQHFTDALVDCMEQVLQQAVSAVIAAEPVAIPLLARFSEVLIQDSTTISLPATLAERFQGCGGREEQGKAALKAQVRLELRTGRIEGPLFQDGRASDRAVAFRRCPPPQALILRDLGYLLLDELALHAQGARFWITRLPTNTACFVEGARVNLLDMLRRHNFREQTTLDLPVQIGQAQRIPC